MILSELLSTLLQLAAFALIPFVVFVAQSRSAKGFWRYVGLYRAPGAAIGLALLASVAFVSGNLGLALANPAIKVTMLDPHSETGHLRQLGLSPATVAVLLLMALGKTSLAEEILFRGFVAKRLMAAWGYRVGNLAQALLFGALHIGLFWSMKPGALFLGFAFAVAGVAAYFAAYLNERRAGGSIVPGWLAHGLANVVSYAVVAFVL